MRRVAGVVLAAGESRRMRGANKLLAELDGLPMVRRVTATAVEAGLDPVIVVLGHDAGGVRRALDDLRVRFVENEGYARGMGTSVRAGIAALPDDGVAGAVILLGDMPWITAPVVRALVDAFEPEAGRGICAPFAGGRRGNPVLWSARYFPALRELDGDVGARELLIAHEDDVCEVGVSGDAVLRDVDTPNALSAARSRATVSNDAREVGPAHRNAEAPDRSRARED